MHQSRRTDARTDPPSAPPPLPPRLGLGGLQSSGRWNVGATQIITQIVGTMWQTKLLFTLLVLAGVVCANHAIGKADRLDNHAEVRSGLMGWWEGIQPIIVV